MAVGEVRSTRVGEKDKSSLEVVRKKSERKLVEHPVGGGGECSNSTVQAQSQLFITHTTYNTFLCRVQYKHRVEQSTE